MWKALNLLFGWEYVMIENCAASYVRRIWWRADGMPMISAYDNQIWPLVPPYHGWSVTPITAGAVEIIRAAKTLKHAQHHLEVPPCQAFAGSELREDVRARSARDITPPQESR